MIANISGTTKATLSRIVANRAGRGGVVLIGGGARVFALASQFVVLLVMSRMLPKAEFGDAMIVFTLYRLIGLGLGTGFGSVLLYHVSRSNGSAMTDIPLLRTITVLAVVVAGAISFATAALAPSIADLFQKPGLTQWLIGMSPMILFGTLNLANAGSLDGRSRVTEAILVTEAAPNALRLLGFLFIAAASLGNAYISHVLWLSLALPWMWDARRLFNGQIPGFAKLRPWDLRYGAWSTINPIAGQQLQGIDMLIVGMLFSSTIAADYSIASRLATLFPFFSSFLSGVLCLPPVLSLPAIGWMSLIANYKKSGCGPLLLFWA